MVNRCWSPNRLLTGGAMAVLAAWTLGLAATATATATATAERGTAADPAQREAAQAQRRQEPPPEPQPPRPPRRPGTREPATREPAPREPVQREPAGRQPRGTQEPAREATGPRRARPSGPAAGPAPDQVVHLDRGTPARGGPGFGAASTTPYAFPARAEHLDPGEYWFWKFPDGHGGGSQKFAYDLTSAQWDEGRRGWTECLIDDSGKARCNRCSSAARNEDCLVYNEPLYSMADGTVLRCWRNAPENPTPGASHPGRTSTPKRIGGGGNALVVQNNDGTVALYAHMKPGTIPTTLCPHNGTLMNDASDKSEAEIPEGQRPRVRRGQMIGRVGNTGASSNPHVHVHLQDGPSGSVNGVPLNFGGALVRIANDDPDGGWIRAKGQQRPGADGLYWPDYSQGFAEIARHGVPSADYQLLFDHVTGSGYHLAWIDGFEFKNRVYFNVVFRPGAAGWAASHNLTGDQYQDVVDTRRKQGYRLRQVESYRVGNSIRYAAVFAKDGGQPVTAYHGRTAAEHQKEFDSLTKNGWRPISLSVASLNGERYYAALYDRGGGGSLIARSQLTGADYQTTVTEQKEAGRQLVYLNAYEHSGQPFFSAIFSSAPDGTFKARHGLTSAQYQNEWTAARKAGLLTEMVTAYADSGGARYAAVWRQP